MRRHRVLRLPIVRGVVALGGSLAIGFRALEVSANAQLPPDEQDGEERAGDPQGGVGGHGRRSRCVLAIVLFFLDPRRAHQPDQGPARTPPSLFWLVEGIVRTAIFLGYMLLLSRLRDLRRVFEYHGAEHKTISCYEAGLPLTPANAAALLAPAPALRHELPARRDDRRDLRVRADRPAGLVLAGGHPHPRRAR